MKTVVKTIFVIFLLFLVLRSCGPLGGSSPLTGKPAPDFQLSDVQGNVVDMTSWRSGRPAILFFWATWCPHCRTQLQSLSVQAAAMRSKGIGILLVDVGEKPAGVAAYLEQNHIDLPTLMDVDNEVSRQYRIAGVPTFIFVGGDGMVMRVTHHLPEDYESILLNLLP